MAVVTNQQSVAALYTAIFNRAPDLAGLNFWTTQLNAGTSFASIAAGFAQHEVFTTGIGALSNAAYVTALYTNILGSAGDTAGIAYWTARLAGGESKASVVADFVHGSLTIDIPALLAAGSITAADAAAAQIRQDTLTNKATTGVYYATTLGAASNLNPNTVATSKAGLLADPAYNASVNAIAGVDNTAASVQAAKDAINVAVGTGNPVNALLGQTLTLTLNQDTLTGGVSNDNFVANGLQNNTGTLSNSLQSADTLNGGSGTDTLKVTLVENAVTVTPTLNSIENVNVTFAGTGTLDLANATGTNTLTATGSTAAGVFDNVGTIANLVVANQSQDATFGKSTATAVNLTLDTVGKAVGPATVTTVVNTVATTLNVTANNAFETIAGLTAVTNLSVAATGASNLNTAALAGTVTSATVTGAGTVNLSGGTFTALTTLNASTNTGGVTASVGAAALTVTGGTGVDVITYAAGPAATAVVNLGAGNDTLILGAAPAAGVTLNGGDGTDTLALAAINYATVAGFTAPNLAKITGFEVLSITDAGGLDAGSTVDVSKLAGITSVAFNGVATGKSATVSNIGANATVTLQGDLATNDGAAVLTLKDATGTADVLNLVLNETGALVAGSVTPVTTAITAAGVETLNVNTTVTSTSAGVTDAKATYALTVADTALTTVKITGNQALTYTTDAAATKLATVDASAATAAVNINLAAVANTSAAVKVTGTALADQFTLTNNAVVTGGLGADKFTIGATANGQTYSTVTDATKGDVFAFTAPASSFTAAKISLGATAVFQDYLDAATAGGVAGKVSWFQTATDTYIVEDNHAGATFTNGVDTVVKLTGLVDLSTANFAGVNLTV